MGSFDDSDRSVMVRVSVGGAPVWTGAAELAEPSGETGGDDTKLSVDLELGSELTDQAWERYERRLEAGPYEGSLEDVLWEFVDVRLSGFDDEE